MVFPLHKGLLLETTGAGGSKFIIAVVVEAELVQPFTVTVTLYVPAFAGTALLITGFEFDEANPFGPVQLYVAPAIVDAVKLKLVPSQTAELFDAVGDAGMGLTITDVLAELLVHCPTVTATEYEPALLAVALLMIGFCCADVKPFGPVQLYIAPATVDANNFSEFPWQTGELLLTVGGVGSGVVVTVTG